MLMQIYIYLFLYRYSGLTAPGLKRLQQQHASFLFVEGGLAGINYIDLYLYVHACLSIYIYNVI